MTLDFNNSPLTNQSCVPATHSKEERKCAHCGGNIAVRNPSGYCDHLYFPESCGECTARETRSTTKESTTLEATGAPVPNDIEVEIEKRIQTDSYGTTSIEGRAGYIKACKDILSSLSRYK